MQLQEKIEAGLMSGQGSAPGVRGWCETRIETI